MCNTKKVLDLTRKDSDYLGNEDVSHNQDRGI